VSDDNIEYRGMIVQYWDLLRGDTSRWSDRFLYREFVKEYGQPVLDVGCATGRILLNFLSEGIDCDGVDISPEMLALCREKAGQMDLSPDLYQQSIETLNLPRTYRTILVPSSTFQLLLDPEQAREGMRRLYAHLKPGGVLVMPFMILWQEGQPLEEESVNEVTRPDGVIVRRISRSRYDPPAQLEHTEDVYQLLKEGEVIDEEHYRRSPATRWYTLDQAEDLYREVGFSQVHFYSNFTREPYLDGDLLFTVAGIK
jgi:ubiquinone/menaquinone biosynthesis C-methylase UbiE